MTELWKPVRGWPAYEVSNMGKRGPKGKRPPVAKLTDDEVREIRAEYRRGGSSHQSIATKFGVSKRSVGRILTDRAYADVR